MGSQGPAPLSLDLFWITLALYLVAFICFVTYLAVQKNVLTKIGLGAMCMGWPFQLVSIILRGIEGNHWPLGNMYEYSMGISFILMTCAIGLSFRTRQRMIGLPSTGVAIALLGVGYVLYEPPGNLVPALHSYWLTIHVTAMATASAILTFSFFFAMAYLLKSWTDKRDAGGTGSSRSTTKVAALRTGKSEQQLAFAVAGASATGATLDLPSVGVKEVVASEEGTQESTSRHRGLLASITDGLPSASWLDSMSYRFVMAGFPVWTFGVICGAIWGEEAWGRYWGWDPKETFAFITWAIFAIYLHARVTFGWKEKRAAIITFFGFASLIVTLYAVNLWIVGLHSYARA